MSTTGLRSYAGAVMTDVAIPAPGVRLRGLRRVEYERLIDTGVLEGERVELLGGELIEVSPQKPPHSEPIARLNSQLVPLMLQGYAVRVQLPLATDPMSLPEPDIAVTDPGSMDAHPTTAHAVIEVAHTSQQLDLVHKAPRYAAAEVPLYVVLDVRAGQAIVHTDPQDGSYGTVRRLDRDDEVVVLGVRLDLAQLLPAR